MALGTFMREFQDEAAAEAALLSLGDIVLLDKVETARGHYQESAGEYVSGAVRRFAQFASAEDWQRLLTALDRSDRPAVSCLTMMIGWSIAQDARVVATSVDVTCSCGGGKGGSHGAM